MRKETGKEEGKGERKEGGGEGRKGEKEEQEETLAFGMSHL